MATKSGKPATFTHPRTGETMSVVVYGARARDGWLLCGLPREHKASFAVHPFSITYR